MNLTSTRLIKRAPVPIVICRNFPYWALFPCWVLFHFSTTEQTLVRDSVLWWGAN